jgi:tetratricopeptide (TPR) repeat protein
MKGYTSQDVAKLLGLTVAQVRGFARDGFLSPAGGGRGAGAGGGSGARHKLLFSFQDLVILRTAKALVAARIPSRRIRRALRELRHQLPRGRSLAELRIVAEGDRIVVSDGDTAWNPESGQTHLDFAVSDLATRAAPIARRTAQAARAAEGDLDAEDWYELGLELEAVDPGEARDAYRRALELDAHHADAHVNLGRLLHEQGLVEEAERHYRLALREDREHATAAFNLGIALEDLDRPVDAVEAYRAALAADPRLADAHYNIARLYERVGKNAAALRHLSIYRRLMVEV